MTDPAPFSRPGRLRVAVIGAGGISQEHLRFLQRSERTQLVGVCDLSPVAGQIAARKFGADASFTDVSEMLARTTPDVVHVLTPPRSHGVLVRLALEAGSDVVCEKPMAPTGREARELLALAEAKGQHLIESHNYRFNSGTQALLGLISSEEVGPVREVEVRMSLPIRASGSRFADPGNPDPIHQMPAGVLHDFITHMAYLLDYLSDQSEWERVEAHWSNHGGGDLFPVDDLDAILVGRNESGPVNGRLRFSALTSPDSFSLTVRGENGQASTDLFHPHLDVRRERSVGAQLTPIANHVLNGAGLVRSGFSNFSQKLLQHTPYHGLERFLEATYEALAQGNEPPVTPRDILAAADLVDAIVAKREQVSDAVVAQRTQGVS